jgi:hypothetical protein
MDLPSATDSDFIFRRNSREKALLSLDADMDSRAPPSAGDVAAAATFLRAAALRFLRSGTASACTDDATSSHMTAERRIVI